MSDFETKLEAVIEEVCRKCIDETFFNCIKQIREDCIEKDRSFKELRDKYQDKLDWVDISKWCPREILQFHKDRIDWVSASENTNLTSEDLKEYSDKLDWNKVSTWVTFDVAMEFKDKIDFKLLNKDAMINLLKVFEAIESKQYYDALETVKQTL